MPIKKLFKSTPLHLCLLLLLVACGEAKAQERKFEVAPFINFNGIDLTGSIRELYSPTNGYFSGTGGLSGGIHLRYKFLKDFYGTLEMRYIRKGSIYSFISPYGTQAFESIHLDYFEIPLGVGYSLKLKKKHLYTETGLAYARMFASNMILSKLNNWDFSDKLNNFRRNDISWVACIKYPILKNESLLIGLRFSHSIFSVHSLYKLFNMDYGIEFHYFLNHIVDSRSKTRSRE